MNDSVGRVATSVGLKQDLMIAVDIAAELAIDDAGPHFADDFFERGDQFRQAERIQGLIGKAQMADGPATQLFRGPAGCAAWPTPSGP